MIDHRGRCIYPYIRNPVQFGGEESSVSKGSTSPLMRLLREEPRAQESPETEGQPGRQQPSTISSEKDKQKIDTSTANRNGLGQLNELKASLVQWPRVVRPRLEPLSRHQSAQGLREPYHRVMQL